MMCRHAVTLLLLNGFECLYGLLAREQGLEEVEAGAVLLKNRARALAAGRKVLCGHVARPPLVVALCDRLVCVSHCCWMWQEDNWKGQLRDLFKLFDVEQRGALDEDQLAMLLKVRTCPNFGAALPQLLSGAAGCVAAVQEMCIPISREELHAAVVDMDVDRNGLIELAEFTQYFVSLGFGDGGEGEGGGAGAYGDASEDSEVTAARAHNAKAPWGSPPPQWLQGCCCSRVSK